MRALIARWWLSDADDAPCSRLGQIELRPHQCSAVARIGYALDEFGGALLCDDVGLGKTYAALAVARNARAPLVVGPAALRAMWFRAASMAGIAISYASFEGLSRNAAPTPGYDFLIVDEAHNARNPATRRYRQLTWLSSGVPLVMLSATPVHNRRRDLTALLALFLGSRADSLTDPEIARCVIRRHREAVGGFGGLPRVTSPQWCHLPHDDSLLEALLALPPPLPPRDGGEGGVLINRCLIRQWASSDAALRAGLRRRLRKAIGLILALESGVYPSDDELSAWTEQEESMQLAFPVLVAARLSGLNRRQTVPDDLLSAARAHAAGIRRITRMLAGSRATDEERAKVIRRLIRRHKGIGIVAFSQYSETVMSLFRLLARDGEVAALTSRGARVAGGRISRGDAISRFAPRAAGASAPSAAERVNLLLTTDLLSEGVNLQDAGVVVHLDIPWTAARMEQRLGRIARLESLHEIVWSYALKPPASADALLRLEGRIEDKLAAAGSAIGSSRPVLPSIIPALSPPCGPPAASEAIREVLQCWLDHEPPTKCSSHVPYGAVTAAPAVTAVTAVSAVSAADDGFLAMCVIDGRKVLLTSVHREIESDLRSALAAARKCSGDTTPIVEGSLEDALRTLHSRLVASDALRGITPDATAVARSRRAVLRRISTISSRSRPHLRARIAALVEAARCAATSDMGIAAESRLRGLASVEMDNEHWLRAVTLVAGAHPAGNSGRPAIPDGIIALILLQKPPFT